MAKTIQFRRSAMANSANDPLAWRGHRDLPERISDDLARRIMSGEFTGGSRLVEADLAAYYNVSRGPVRDALRMLTARGLAELFPRRGAVVAAFDKNVLADCFNIHATLSGLNARYAALMWRPPELAEFRRRVDVLKALTLDDSCKPLRFALESGRIGGALSRCSNSPILQRTMTQNANDIVWSLLWREFHVDFHTVARRRQNAEIWEVVLGHVERRAAEAADLAMQELICQCRDTALETMTLADEAEVDPRRLWHPPAGWR